MDQLRAKSTRSLLRSRRYGGELDAAISSERFGEVMQQLQAQSGDELLGLAQSLLRHRHQEAAKIKQALESPRHPSYQTRYFATLYRANP